METIIELTKRYPLLSGCADDIVRAGEILKECFGNGHRLYTCGNGGSSSDADHIVGELMKGFLKKRPVDDSFRERLSAIDPENADFIADNLQCGLPAISLHSQSALLTAFANDVDASMMFAQTLFALGNAGDVLIAISTSGNSKNVVNTAKLAAAMGINVIALTGENSCILDKFADCVIHVGACETYRVQELHLPVYHWLCAKIEDEFYSD